MLTNNKFSILQ